MDNIEKKFHWCLDKGKTGGRKHHGLRKIKTDPEEANNHIQKALHNLEAVDHILTPSPFPLRPWRGNFTQKPARDF